MRTRPWPLVLLAVIQIFTPLMTVLFNAAAMKVSPMTIVAWIFERQPLEIFETLLLMPIAGIAIYMMKRWSYAVFLIAVSWSAYRNISHWDYASTLIPSPALLLVYLSEAAFVGYFLLPAVRATYFNPNVRWWEHKPRYILELVAEIVVAGKKREVKILNVSEGGAFLSLGDKLERGTELQLEFKVITLPYSVKGRIVHIREISPGNYCYGVQFAHTSDTQVRLQSLADALDTLGYNERDERRAWHVELREWASTLFKTGKGLVPEVQNKNKKAS